MGGGGWPRPRLRAPSSCRPPGPRSCQLARYPRTTPAISTASLPVLARRFRADPHEVGRIEGIGLDSLELGAACRPGPASAASRSLQKIVGAIVGAAYRAGREHLRGFESPRRPPRGPRLVRDPSGSARASVRDASETCAGGHVRLVEAGAVKSCLALVDAGKRIPYWIDRRYDWPCKT